MKATKMNRQLLHSLLALALAVVTGLGFAIGTFCAETAGDISASATVQFLYEGAADGVDPDGNVFSPDTIISEEIVSGALEDLGWQDRFSAADVRKYLTVTGNYPKDIVESVTDYDSVLDYNGVRTLKISSYYTTSYSVTLCGGFAGGATKAELKTLVDAITAAYKASFIRTYSHTLVLTGLDSLLSVEEHDYTHKISLLKTNLSLIRNYADRMYALEPAFTDGGTSFRDLSLRCAALQESKLDKMNINVTMNGLTTDAGALVNEYRYAIEKLQLKLTELTADLTAVTELIDAYKRDSTLYIGSGDSVTRVESKSGETYDTLTARKSSLASEIASLNSDISEYENRIADVQATASDALYAALDSDIAYVQAQILELKAQFDTLALRYDEKYICEGCLSCREAVVSDNSVLSAAFIVDCVKCIGPFGVLAVAFILAEFTVVSVRDYRKKNARSAG